MTRLLPPLSRSHMHFARAVCTSDASSLRDPSHALAQGPRPAYERRTRRDSRQYSPAIWARRGAAGGKRRQRGRGYRGATAQTRALEPKFFTLLPAACIPLLCSHPPGLVHRFVQPICSGKFSFIAFVRAELKNYKEQCAKFGDVDGLTGIHVSEVHGKVHTEDLKSMFKSAAQTTTAANSLAAHSTRSIAKARSKVAPSPQAYESSVQEPHVQVT
jgi:hypothetical protein